MNYREIIVESWKSTQSDKKIIFWFGFFPAIFTTTVGVFYITYQIFALKNSYLFSDTEKNFLGDVVIFIWDFIKAHVSWTVPLIIFSVIFALFYFLFPTLAKASAIQAIARKINGQPYGVGIGLKHGIMSYLQLFEYHLLIKTFAFFSILVEMSFVLRNLGVQIFEVLIPFFILFVIISFCLTLLFTYADLFIVIDGNGVFESMKKSAKLVVMHWKYTFLISLLMILIGLRIIFQVVIVFLIPLLILLITGYLATIALPVTSVIIGGIIGVACLFLAAYLNGIVDVFSYTVWTRTFLEISSEKELSARDVLEDNIGENPSNSGDHENLHNIQPIG